MDEPSNYGTAWRKEEIAYIFRAYLQMLEAELYGQPFVKAIFGQDVMRVLGRSHRSVEFKNQNISAVLDTLGLPWIKGYKPKYNFQKALLDEIEHYLTDNPSTITILSSPVPNSRPAKAEFVNPPTIGATPKPTEYVSGLIRRFDPVERDRLNRKLGDAGEEFVVEMERRTLTDGGHGRLAKQVQWISKDIGDGAGYDIISFHMDGRHKLIEVKTTNGSIRTPFFISRNEFSASCARPESWILYRLFDFSASLGIYQLRPPIEQQVHLVPQSWRASFGESV